ncbi:MAG TPA: ABC transporter, partial [Halococcus sp.]|nr:ABC transporter [Halococcus sp.]
GTPEAVLTENHVERAFDTDAAVTRHPVTGAMDVTAVSAPPERKVRVHVLGGGRTGARAIATLAEAGFSVSTGVLTTTDAALETARAHEVETVTTEPFAPVDRNTRKRVTQLVREADIAVLARTDEPNRALAAEAERLVVIDDERTDRMTEFENARVVGIDGLLAGVETALDTEPRRPELSAADD